MSVERELIISILKLTKKGPASFNVAAKDAKIPQSTAENLVKRLEDQGLLYLSDNDNALEAVGSQRLKLAVRAVMLGGDIQRVASHLEWREFEKIAAVAFQANEYKTINLRFKHAGRRWEIDIVGCKKPLLLCIDCKHWHHGLFPSVIARVAKEQLTRTSALVNSLPRLANKLGCASWAAIEIVPAILSLFPSRSRYYNRVPIVSILELRDFLSNLPAHLDSVNHISISLADKLNDCS